VYTVERTVQFICMLLEHISWLKLVLKLTENIYEQAVVLTKLS